MAEPRLELDGVALRQVVLYEKPTDYPGHFVVREFFIRESGTVEVGNVAYLFKDESTARAWIAKKFRSLVPVNRQEDDDPAVLGVWT